MSNRTWGWYMDIRAGNYCCSMDQEPVIYIEDQYSKGSLSSSLVILTTRWSSVSFAEVSKLQVPFWRVVATTFVKTQFFQTTQPSKKLSKKYLRPYKIIAQPGTLSFTLYLSESIHSVHPVFHVSTLKPAMSNIFSKRIQLAPAPVIIDREPKYEISQIVNSKIDCW